MSKNPIYSCPGGGDSWTKIFLPGRAFDQQRFQKFKCPEIDRGSMLKFQIDRYITGVWLEKGWPAMSSLQVT